MSVKINNPSTPFIILIFFITACSENIEKKSFKSFLNEPCMIVNQEQDNTIEGKYLIAKAFRIGDSTLKMKMPENFYVNYLNCKD